MIVRFKKPSVNNPNRNNFITLKSRRVGCIYRIYGTYSEANATRLKKNTCDFNSLTEVFAFFDRMDVEMIEKGWTKIPKK